MSYWVVNVRPAHLLRRKANMAEYLQAVGQGSVNLAIRTCAAIAGFICARCLCRVRSTQRSCEFAPESNTQGHCKWPATNFVETGHDVDAEKS